MPEGGWFLIDLFCSRGGYSFGARALGHEVALAIDMDGDQLDVHALNHPEARHVQMELGPRTEEIVLKLIDEAVPASERHRLWLHGSPPCQSQSLLRQLGAASSATGRKTFAAINQKNNPLSEVDRIEGRRAYDEEFQSNKKTGLELVKWTIDLIVKVNQLPSRQLWIAKEMMALMQEAKRNHPDLFDCVAVQMAEYGVPHLWERAIEAAQQQCTAQPRSLRARSPTVREMLHETLEPELVYVYGTVTRAIAPKGTMDHKVRPANQQSWVGHAIAIHRRPRQHCDADRPQRLCAQTVSVCRQGLPDCSLC